ncbi:MAG: hypothetical protein ACTSYD_08200 [Candidatus Heimdallarchaeaceae archaeon]
MADKEKLFAEVEKAKDDVVRWLQQEGRRIQEKFEETELYGDVYYNRDDVIKAIEKLTDRFKKILDSVLS